MKKIAAVDKKRCVACGACVQVCPKAAIFIDRGCWAVVDDSRCVGCGLCGKNCPAGCISRQEVSK
ncbi:MAG: 4Fe-4S binding protein [Oscillospiraceae bacterium]|nr:4Fe-4S binding protein [Oscillospiraceae bacterium]